MMPERMTKMRIVAPKTFMESIIRELHRLKAIHIVEHVKTEVDTGEPLPTAEKLSELLVITRSVGAHLKIDFSGDSAGRAYLSRNIAEIERSTMLLQKEVNGRLERQKTLDERKKAIQQTEAELEILRKINLPLEAYGGYKSLSCIMGRIKNSGLLRKNLHKITEKFQLHSSEDKTCFALFIESGKKAEAYELLNSQGFSEITTASASGLKGSAESNLKKISEEMLLLEKQQQTIQAELQKLRDKWKETIILSEKMLSEELEKAEAPLRFASTKNIFMIEGWVPSKSAYSLKQKLEKVSSGKIYIKEEETHEDAPVKLNNKKFAKPFEFLINLRGLPLYHEIDPTLILFFTFPLFFGFMLGDIGYGLVTLAISLILMKKMKSARNMMSIMALSSISSIVFGFAFGEFFGEESIMGIALPHLVSRVHPEGIQTVFVSALAFGAIHINLGLALGFYNELRHHGLKQAMLEKFSWIMIELGAPFILSSLGIIKLPQHLIYMSMASLLAGVVMLATGEMKIGNIGAFKAVVESITIFSNILSYARLMAVGLASVQLALIINEFAKQSFHQGGTAIIAGVLILLLGHTMNIVLGLMGAFLHSLRLEYVEFFTKFFIGGAKPYIPFGEINSSR